MDYEKDFSRRDFLKTTGAAGLGLLTAATVPQTLGAQESGRVPTRPFGKTGDQVAILSLGGMFDIPSNQLMLRQAVKWGVTYWDTANSYEGGNSEIGIGKYFAKYPEDRRSIFLVTKSTAWTLKGMTEHLDLSLERMRTDHVDLFFVHAIRSVSSMSKDMQQWGETAKAQGKIRFFGFSTHSNMEECLLGAASLGWIDGIMMTYNYRLMHTDAMRRAVDACTRAGIGLTAMKTQGGGQVLTGNANELSLGGRFLQSGYTQGQAKLKAVWENPNIACICSQMPSLTILSTNVAASRDLKTLARSDFELLERLAMETCTGYCAGCGHICQAAVGGTVPVSDVMRCLMYYRDYGDRDLAREVYAGLSEEVTRRLTEVDYSKAERACPQGLAIAKLMREASRLLA